LDIAQIGFESGDRDCVEINRGKTTKTGPQHSQSEPTAATIKVKEDQ
jgi:hypothetical protein